MKNILIYSFKAKDNQDIFKTLNRIFNKRILKIFEINNVDENIKFKLKMMKILKTWNLQFV